MDENRIEVPNAGRDLLLRVGSVIVVVIGFFGLMYLLAGNVPDAEQSSYAAANTANATKGNLQPMANRKPEVDKALEDVDFTKNTYQILLDTELGKIKLDLYPDVAPGHCRNIIGLTKIGYYDGIIFHRVIKDFVCQVGCPQGDGTGGPGYKIKAEFNDKPHVAGTLSMARTNDPDSAGSQVFICLGRVPHLDNKYTVFGQTADKESLDNVLKFNKIRTAAGDRPVDNVTIKKATVIVTPK